MGHSRFHARLFQRSTKPSRNAAPDTRPVPSENRLYASICEFVNGLPVDLEGPDLQAIVDHATHAAPAASSYGHDGVSIPYLLARLYVDTVAPGGKHPWCDVRQFLIEYQRLRAAPRSRLSDADQLYLDLLDEVARSGLARAPLPLLAADRVLEMRAQFPHFAAPLQYVAEQLAIAQFRRQRRLTLQPLLLVGPPGVGKTHFARALAAMFGTHLSILDMASLSCGFTMSGMARGWSSAAPGSIYKSLQQGQFDAPVMLLDELDKSSQDSRSSPNGPLYTLLERHAAASFKDEYLGFTLDASKILWLATANDISAIDPALLSRFRVFDIAAPTRDQASRIADQLLAEACADLAVPLLTMPEVRQADLAALEPRQMRQMIEAALGRAALRALTAKSPHLEVLPEDLQPTTKQKRQGIGFLDAVD